MNESEKDDAIEALACVLERIQEHYGEEAAKGPPALAGRPESVEYGHWRTQDVLEQLLLARSQFGGLARPKLLECGAGFGFVATLARELGFAVTGLEVDPGYYEGARKLFPLTQVVEEDLLTYEDWGSFDVIYYYAPFREEHAEVAERFETTVEEGLRPGGVIIANGKVSTRWKDDPRFEELRSEAEIAYVIRKKP